LGYDIIIKKGEDKPEEGKKDFPVTG